MKPLPRIYTFDLRADNQPPTVVTPCYTETIARYQASPVNLPTWAPYANRPEQTCHHQHRYAGDTRSSCDGQARVVSASPVKVDVVARSHCGSIWVVAYRSPNLRLKLTGRNVIAEERVVCVPCQYPSFPHSAASSLTAVEPTWVVNRRRAVSQCAADARRVAPHHLREVAPRVVVVWVVVRVLGLLLVPAMDSSAGKLYPSLVAVGNGLDRGKVAASAFLPTLDGLY